MAYVNKNNKTRRCEWCGKEFVLVMHSQKFCCKKCRDEQTKKQNREKTARRKTVRNTDLTKTVELARKAGMSYGKYKALEWLKENSKHDAS